MFKDTVLYLSISLALAQVTTLICHVAGHSDKVLCSEPYMTTLRCDRMICEKG